MDLRSYLESGIWKALDQKIFVFSGHMSEFFIHLIIGFVVTPLTFFKMKNKVFLNPIKFCQASFGETPESLDTIDVNASVCEGLGLVDSDVSVVPERNQAIIGFPIIGDDNAIGTDLAGDNGKKRFRRSRSYSK